MKLSKEQIERYTYWSKQRYESEKEAINRYENDVRRKTRLAYRRCKTCFYLRLTLAGSAFTNYECQHCKGEFSHPNTDVPKYCNNCSDQFGVCVDCGAEIEQ